MTKAHATAKKAKHPNHKAASASVEARASGANQDTHPTVSGSQADYDAFLPHARKLSATEIIPMRADPQLALHNLQVGVANVLAEAHKVAALPDTDARHLSSLPRLALGVIFASTQLVPRTATTGLRQQLSRGNELRALLLKTADALVAARLLPTADVDKIRAGHGKLDAARDLVALSALYGKHAAAVRGKHAVSAAQLKEAADVGTELLKVLKPGRATRKASAPAVGTEERDRLWTLLVHGHDHLWRAGAYMFGRDVDAKVPALQANRGGRPKKTVSPPAPPPAPAK